MKKLLTAIIAASVATSCQPENIQQNNSAPQFEHISGISNKKLYITFKDAEADELKGTIFWKNYYGDTSTFEMGKFTSEENKFSLPLNHLKHIDTAYIFATDTKGKNSDTTAIYQCGNNHWDTESCDARKKTHIPHWGGF